MGESFDPNKCTKYDSLFDVGYKYKITCVTTEMLPLFVKYAMDIGPIFRQYPAEKFKVSELTSK